MREYKMTLPTGGNLYARISDRQIWTCEIKGAAKWYPVQRSEDPVWISNRKWDGLPKTFEIEPEAWNEFRQGVQQQEENAENQSKEPEEEGITEEIKAKALDILKTGKPVDYFLDTFNKIHVGDRDLGEILIYCTGSQLNKTSNGLHPKLSGESGMGKSDAVETFLHCLPKCAYIKTSLSSKSIFYHDIKPGTLIFLDDYKQNDDLDAIIKQTSSRFHEPYEHRTIDKDREAQIMVAPPEIVWAITSVDTSQDIQVLNRQVGLDVDATEDTTRSVIEHLLAQAEHGEERFPLTEEVLICRAMILELKRHCFKVAIPFAKRIKWQDLSSRRNPSIFLDLIRSNAVWHFMQRVNGEDDFIEANEDDFVSAKRLYVGRADTLIDKLSKPERRLAEAILENHGEMYRDEAAAKLKVSVNRISQLTHGENGKTGLIQKLPGFNVEKVTLRDDVRSVQKTMLTMVGYDKFKGFDSIVTLEPPLSTEGRKDGVSEELTPKTVSSHIHSKLVSNIEDIRERDLHVPRENLENNFSPEKPKTPYFLTPRSLIAENGLTGEFMRPNSHECQKDSLQNVETRHTNLKNRVTAEEQKMLESMTADAIKEDKFKLKRCEECGKSVTALYEIGEGEFVMRMCKVCYDAYLDDISGV